MITAKAQLTCHAILGFLVSKTNTTISHLCYKFITLIYTILTTISR